MIDLGQLLNSADERIKREEDLQAEKRQIEKCKNTEELFNKIIALVNNLFLDIDLAKGEISCEEMFELLTKSKINLINPTYNSCVSKRNYCYAGKATKYIIDDEKFQSDINFGGWGLRVDVDMDMLKRLLMEHGVLAEFEGEESIKGFKLTIQRKSDKNKELCDILEKKIEQLRLDNLAKAVNANKLAICLRLNIANILGSTNQRNGYIINEDLINQFDCFGIKYNNVRRVCSGCVHKWEIDDSGFKIIFDFSYECQTEYGEVCAPTEGLNKPKYFGCGFDILSEIDLEQFKSTLEQLGLNVDVIIDTKSKRIVRNDCCSTYIDDYINKVVINVPRGLEKVKVL